MSNENTIKELELLREELLEKVKKIDITIDTLRTLYSSGSATGGTNVSHSPVVSNSSKEGVIISDKISSFPNGASFRQKVVLVPAPGRHCLQAGPG